MSTVTNPSDIPKDSHFQIVFFKQIQEKGPYDDLYRNITEIEIVDCISNLQKRVAEIDKSDRDFNKTTKYVVQRIDRICPVITQVIVSVS